LRKRRDLFDEKNLSKKEFPLPGYGLHRTMRQLGTREKNYFEGDDFSLKGKFTRTKKKKKVLAHCKLTPGLLSRPKRNKTHQGGKVAKKAVFSAQGKNRKSQKHEEKLKRDRNKGTKSNSRLMGGKG